MSLMITYECLHSVIDHGDIVYVEHDHSGKIRLDFLLVVFLCLLPLLE